MKLTNSLFKNCHRKILFYLVFLLGALPLSSKPSEVSKLHLNVGDIYYYEVSEKRIINLNEEARILQWIQLKVTDKVDKIYKMEYTTLRKKNSLLSLGC